MNFVNTFDQLTNIAQIVRKCPTGTLSRAYTRAMKEFCHQSQWLRLSIPGATTINVRTYSLGSDPLLDVVGIYAMQGSQDPNTGIQFWPINTSDPTQWDPNMPADMPVRYAYIPEGQFGLDPIPLQVYQLLISAIVTPKEGVAQVPSEPLVKYSNDIEAGALAYLLMLPGQPWTDKLEGARQMAAFKSGISNAKAEVQRSYNTGSVRVRPRGFIL